MACQCKNEDGTLSNYCRGLCSKSSVIMVDEQERAAIFGEHISQQISILSQQINGLQVKIDEAYKQGFKEGFAIGFEEGKSY